MMARSRLDPAFVKQVRNLLQKPHVPRVTVKKSSIPSAGHGVYSNVSVFSQESPHVMCLYPGVYTPGIPATMYAGDTISNEYLANKTKPPSGISFEANAYIVNLPECGGYIDGCPHLSIHGTKVNENPSACGHLINHDASNANVQVASFFWNEILDKTDIAHARYSLPNRVRRDGSPWYFDGRNEEVVNFSREPEDFSEEETSFELLCGMAMILSSTIEPGQELLLDYGLKKPYPEWASDWYVGR